MLKEEIKQVQEIALIAAKTASMVTHKAVMEKIEALEQRLSDLEKVETVEKKSAKSAK